jgi:hypothetical protein
MTYLYASEEPERFLRAFNNLAVSKSGEHDDVEYESYFELLSELPIDSVERAARELKRTPGAFMPDAGTWFRLADNMAAESLVENTNTDIKQLYAPRDTEGVEVKRIKVARAKFVSDMEKLTGRVLPNDHPMKVSTPKVPTYACSTCRDLGWVETENRRYRHCQCWSHNPVLEKERLKSRLKRTRTHVK